MLENLRDFPRSLFGLQYQNYSDGILYGCDITGTETGMILLPGILCYKGFWRDHILFRVKQKEKWHM